MKKEKIYVVTEDLQGETFKVGFAGTADMFKQAFLYYAEEHEDAIAKLNTLEGQELIDFIADYWELKIEETTLEKLYPMPLTTLVELLVKAKKEYLTHNNQYAETYRKYGVESKEFKEWSETNKLLNEKYSKLYTKFNRLKQKDRKILIQYPEQIIGGRVITGYGGKLESFEVNDLTRITLSEVNEEGKVQMPYKLTLEGIAIRSEKTYTYKIRRDEGKVYWVILEEDIDAMARKR